MKKILFFPLLFLSLSCGQGDPVPEARCASLMVSHCLDCHHSARICQQLGRKSRAGWEKTMDSMIRLGARLTDEERRLAIDCLSAARPGAEFICAN